MPVFILKISSVIFLFAILTGCDNSKDSKSLGIIHIDNFDCFEFCDSGIRIPRNNSDLDTISNIYFLLRLRNEYIRNGQIWIEGKGLDRDSDSSLIFRYSNIDSIFIECAYIDLADSSIRELFDSNFRDLDGLGFRASIKRENYQKLFKHFDTFKESLVFAEFMDDSKLWIEKTGEVKSPPWLGTYKLDQGWKKPTNETRDTLFFKRI